MRKAISALLSLWLAASPAAAGFKAPEPPRVPETVTGVPQALNLPPALATHGEIAAPAKPQTPLAPQAAGVPEAPQAAGPDFDGSQTRPPAGGTPLPAEPWVFRHDALVRRTALSGFVRAFYKVRARGLENLPPGPSLIVANHVTYVDGILMSFALGRPMRFMLQSPLFRRLPFFFKHLGAIPVHHTDTREQKVAAIEEARGALKRGQSVVIFPEGMLTRNGNMNAFKSGFVRIAQDLGVPVVPVHFDGLWGSVFSMHGMTVLGKAVRALAALVSPRPVIVRAGAPLANVEPQAAREAVQLLGVESMEERVRAKAVPLPRMFVRNAKRYWSREAFVDASKVLTYGRALTASVLLSAALSPLIGGNRSVGVFLPPSNGGALANLALGLRGRATVNLNYTAGADPLASAVEKNKIEVVVTSRRFLAELQKKKKDAALPPGRFIYLEDVLKTIPRWRSLTLHLLLRLLPAWAVEALFARQAARSLDEIATVLMTSGSDASPKGVPLTHLNIQADLEMVDEVFPSGKRETLLGVLPFFHSFGMTMTLWFPIRKGFKVVYHPSPFDHDAIAKLGEKHPYTVIMGTSMFLQKWAQKVRRTAFASVRFVIAGAAKLERQVADEFKTAFGLDILEGYGLTETSPVTSVNLPNVKGQVGDKPGTVGHPLPGSVIRVVDVDTGEPLPYGQLGRILIKGPHVMKGYLDDPEKTAAAFKDGWYDTEDAGTLDADGFPTIVDRLKDFTNIGGEKFSNTMIESKLQEASGLAERAFAVAAVPDAKRGERPAVLYTGAFAGSLDELLEKARELKLSPTAVPAKTDFHKVEALPVLGSGKLDKKAVRALLSELSK